MYELFWILLVTTLDGLVAFVGALTLGLSDKTLNRVLFVLIAFSAGTMISGSLLHLLSESFEALDVDTSMLLFIGGFSAFFLIERLLHWHHCHEGKCDVHVYSYLILFGDGIHNLIDGLVIAAAFLTDISLGFITSFLILAHEIPQEFGDFAVLLHGGMKKTRALLYNFISQLTAVLGGLIGFFWFSEELRFLMLPFAAGGFMYIAASDLIPELHKEPKLSKAILAFMFFVVGVLLMLAIKIMAHGGLGH
ncbi:MAG: ZIP family metal transporter [Candidatus Altiarchaeota archaeon]|nr:ZIP family metal transporter [Candidatus Altiarchaeota archaeon]